MASSNRERDRVATYANFKHKAAQTFIMTMACAAVGLFTPGQLLQTELGAQRLAFALVVTFGLLGLFKTAYVLINGLAENDGHDVVGMQGYAAMAFILLLCGFVVAPKMLSDMPAIWNQVHLLLVLLALAAVVVRFGDHALCWYRAQPKRVSEKTKASTSAPAA